MGFRWVGKQQELLTKALDQLHALEVRLHKLETREAARDRELRELTVEWNSTYEKFNTLWARLKKRVPKEPQDAPGSTNGDTPRVNPLALELLRSGRR